ncbi:MAG: hypothetical protein ABH884_02545 [Candidatus Komeilibacteria bacterium]
MDQDIDLKNLCKACCTEPIYMEGLCEFCYGEELELEALEEDERLKEIMPKHGQDLKQNQDLQTERSLKKISKEGK